MKTPVHEADVAWQVWALGTPQEVRGKALSDVGGRAKVGVGLMELAPGCDTRPAHYHSHEEEHLYVLEGCATLHLGDQVFALRPGSFACFPAGQALSHYLANTGVGPFRYIMIGERIPEDIAVHEAAGR